MKEKENNERKIDKQKKGKEERQKELMRIKEREKYIEMRRK